MSEWYQRVSVSVGTLPLHPCPCRWCVPLTPPADAHDMEMAFTDGQQTWDSNDGLNYCVPLQKGVSGGADGMQGSASANSLALASSMRGVTSEESYPHAGGMLHILNLAPYAPTHAQGSDAAAAAAAARASRWCDERRVRVWTPPGYSREAAPPGGWPVLYMHDGQNMFEDWLAHQVGSVWRCGVADWSERAVVCAGNVGVQCID